MMSQESAEYCYNSPPENNNKNKLAKLDVVSGNKTSEIRPVSFSFSYIPEIPALAYRVTLPSPWLSLPFPPPFFYFRHAQNESKRKKKTQKEELYRKIEAERY